MTKLGAVFAAVALFAAAALAPARAPAQEETPSAATAGPGGPPAVDDGKAPPPPPPRRTWYVGAALGYGDGSLAILGRNTSLRDYMDASPTRIALAFEGGRQLGAKLRGGADLVWLRAAGSRGGATAAIDLLHAGIAASFHPFGRGLFLRGGAGYARLGFDTRATGFHQSEAHGGFGLVGGAGYALALGRSFDAFARLEAMHQWYDVPRIGLQGATFWAAYVGVLWF